MRLDSGLSVLQTVDLILAWICMEDDGVRFWLRSRVLTSKIKSHVDLLLARKSLSMRDIVEVLNGECPSSSTLTARACKLYCCRR